MDGEAEVREEIEEIVVVEVEASPRQVLVGLIHLRRTRGTRFQALGLAPVLGLPAPLVLREICTFLYGTCNLSLERSLDSKA